MPPPVSHHPRTSATLIPDPTHVIACPRSHRAHPSRHPRPLQLWNVLIIFLDAVYTALWVPVIATFELPHRIDTPSGALDFAVGLILCTDIFVRFHAPIFLTSTYKSLTLNTPRSIAAFYCLRGSFFLDAAAAIPLVFLPFLEDGSEFVIVVLVLRILRLARVKRVIDMLFYIQMMSVSGASNVRMLVGSVISILYTIAVMTNLLACLWYWIGRRSPPDEGWLSQEYSARSPFPPPQTHTRRPLPCAWSSLPPLRERLFALVSR